MFTPDQSTSLSMGPTAGTVQWMSPELLDPKNFGLTESCPRIESDCYALGMVIYEVLSGQKPFSTYRDAVIVLQVLYGQRPKRPQGEAEKWITNDIWDMVELCWKAEPSERITAKDILQGLEGKPYPSRSPSDLNEGVVKGDAGGSLVCFLRLGPGSSTHP